MFPHLVWLLALRRRDLMTYLKNWFLLSKLEVECLLARIRCTIIFIKFLFQDKKWQRLQYCYFHQYQQIFAVARWNHPYMWLLTLYYSVFLSYFKIIISNVSSSNNIWHDKSYDTNTLLVKLCLMFDQHLLTKPASISFHKIIKSVAFQSGRILAQSGWNGEFILFQLEWNENIPFCLE